MHCTLFFLPLLRKHTFAGLHITYISIGSCTLFHTDRPNSHINTLVRFVSNFILNLFAVFLRFGAIPQTEEQKQMNFSELFMLFVWLASVLKYFTLFAFDALCITLTSTRIHPFYVRTSCRFLPCLCRNFRWTSHFNSFAICFDGNKNEIHPKTYNLQTFSQICATNA